MFFSFLSFSGVIRTTVGTTTTQVYSLLSTSLCRHYDASLYNLYEKNIV